MTVDALCVARYRSGMKRSPFQIAGAAVTMFMLVACETPPKEGSQTAPADWNVLSKKALASSHGKIDFATHVKPVLEAKCVVCHQREVLPFFSLENRELAFGEGKMGVRIIPGKPDESRLLMHAHGATPGLKRMPPVGDCLTRDESRILRAWIAQGANWPTGAAGQLDPHAEYHR